MKLKLIQTITLLILTISTLYGKTELVGEISIPDGKKIPKEGVHIHILGENKDFFTTQDGKYIFENLKESSYYRIRVLIYGFQAQEFSVITSSKPTTKFNIDYQMDCQFDAKRALNDWQDGNAKIFSAPYSYPKTDSIFQAKYNVEYFNTHPLNPNELCIDGYNSEIFKLLDSKFGENWRKEVRPFLLSEK